MKLFVGGLAWATTDASLRSAFENYGDVSDAFVVKDRETGRSRGFGFVTFAQGEDGKKALEAMNGATLDGRQIRCNEADTRGRRRTGDDRRGPPDSRGGSRPRSFAGREEGDGRDSGRGSREARGGGSRPRGGGSSGPPRAFGMAGPPPDPGRERGRKKRNRDRDRDRTRDDGDFPSGRERGRKRRKSRGGRSGDGWDDFEDDFR